MKWIDPQLYMHCIYTKKDTRPIWQPQRRLNLHLKDIVKVELQKFLDVNFIYPISDSKRVSPLVVLMKNNEKLRICVYYRELNKVTQKNHFPLPFIDQVLDTLTGKHFFSFLYGFSRYIQFRLPLKIRIRILLLALGEHLLIGSYLLGYLIPLPHFRGLYLVYFHIW